MIKDVPTIGVLALQGAVQLHRPHIEASGAKFAGVKTPAEFEDIDAFILPGGESTTMLKLIDRFDLWESLAENFEKKPVWGICAGSILIAKTVLNPKQLSFGLLPMTIERNGYGRQIDSHLTQIEGYDVSLIRAPVITQVANDVEVFASHEGAPVWVKHGPHMATTFHPELTQDFPSPMHRAFIDLVRESA